MCIGLLGASGTLGTAIGAELTGHGVVWRPIRRGDDAGSLPGEQPLLIAAAGGDLEATRVHVRRAIEAGVDVIDIDRAPPQLRMLHTELGPHAERSGSRVIAGAGLRWTLGDALAAEAAGTVHDPRAVHVAYTGGGGPASWRLGTPGERRARIAGLGAPATALVDGGEVDELPGEVRRLAWFPRPVGPSHAAGVPGGEFVTVPRHLPGVTTVRTYEAVSGWRAELLQATANLARSERGRAWLARRGARGARSPSPVERTRTRWGCVAEVAGSATVGRAWAYGHDPVRLTAAIAVLLARTLLATPSDALAGGALAPSEVVPARMLLDELAERTDLRWSRTTVELPAEARLR